MDCRIDPIALLGFEPGDAHVLRNAGAVVTDDVLRSLVLSQRAIGTRSVTVIAHTGCGIHDLDDGAFRRDLTAETGAEPPFEFGSFTDLDDHVRVQLERVRECPWLLHTEEVDGYVFDVVEGSLRPVK
jgi:carbonic anhydrase